MTEQQVKLEQFDEWLRDGSDVAALVMRQWLDPVEGSDATIFPPTYTLRDTDAGARFNKGEPVPGVFQGSQGPYGYNIDRFYDGTSVCQVDSVGSQANRMEPIFKRELYRRLVPQIVIKANNGDVNLLDAGHRAADGLVRFSDLAGELREAFEVWQDGGDAEPLAKIAPTTIVFGAWDSRATQAKLPRIVRSVIRAYDVRVLHRSAQYVPPLDYVADGVLDEPADRREQEARSELGLSHAPAPWSHGGVIVRGEIRRDATLSLEAIRSLGAKGDPVKLRRYILGLALVAFTARQESLLREGCQLVPSRDRVQEWKLVRYDGSRDPYEIKPDDAKAFAELAAKAFGVGEGREVMFKPQAARKELGMSGEERKAARTKRARGGSKVTK
jgi:CRISPR-associated protein Csb1